MGTPKKVDREDAIGAFAFGGTAGLFVGFCLLVLSQWEEELITAPTAVGAVILFLGSAIFCGWFGLYLCRGSEGEKSVNG